MSNRTPLAMLLLLYSANTPADDARYILNFDLNTTLPDGSVEYSIQLQGIHLSPAEAFHGGDLGNYEYFLTVTEVQDSRGKLTIEFYQYATRKKESDVISEVVTSVDFSLGHPTVFEAMSGTFGIVLAFNITER